MSMSAALSAASRFPCGLTAEQEREARDLYAAACAAQKAIPPHLRAGDHEILGLSRLTNSWSDSLARERIQEAMRLSAKTFSDVVNDCPDQKVRAEVWAMVNDT